MYFFVDSFVSLHVLLTIYQNSAYQHDIRAPFNIGTLYLAFVLISKPFIQQNEDQV